MATEQSSLCPQVRRCITTTIGTILRRTYRVFAVDSGDPYFVMQFTRAVARVGVLHYTRYMGYRVFRVVTEPAAAEQCRFSGETSAACKDTSSARPDENILADETAYSTGSEFYLVVGSHKLITI